MVAHAQSLCGGVSNEVVLRAHLDTYESRVFEFGEEGEPTILACARYAELLLQFAGPLYAKAPLGCKRRREALDILLRMKAISVRVFGPDHFATGDIERVFGEYGLVE
jgi:hypothetical protein